MVAHQAVRSDSHFVFQGVFQQQVQIDLPVFVIEEYRGAAVAALRDVMRAKRGMAEYYRREKAGAIEIWEVSPVSPIT